MGETAASNDGRRAAADRRRRRWWPSRSSRPLAGSPCIWGSPRLPATSASAAAYGGSGWTAGRPTWVIRHWWLTGTLGRSDRLTVAGAALAAWAARVTAQQAPPGITEPDRLA